ncbi:GntR family transcriptional regulator [Phycicoccus duodecadis]|jgi:DNA-binding GntR family transcriptional regulator|uniref:GntR family transcriptional regulator n=1 Tax=Phycicoccus duodecadis TaxID=173053 RepID=A0A2N3YIY2_9MICO|nr:GntR family transcriptional regulator [Phycicoccus duodecadis]PKW26816.1 GntR family transcriptional regulator [Phycicoccus duodecadis]
MAAARPRASDVAYQEILDRILDMRLPPGAQVNEISLAEELGLSRMPVHEAVARLAVDRFVTVQPRRGSYVSALQVEDVLDMFEAREAIECGVAHIAARRASDADLAQLRALVQDAEQAREGFDHDRFLRDDLAIHQFLVHMVRNTLLQDAADRLLLHNVRFWRSYWASRPALEGSMISHEALLLALESRDAEGAERAMRQHIFTSLELVQAPFRGPR